jgi:outer membrane protein OmpA-like peptidoglycan-associated protein
VSWVLALLTVPTVLATVAVLTPAADPPEPRHLAGPGDGAVAAPSIVAAPTGVGSAPADRDPAAVEHARVATLLAERPVVFTADSAELTPPAAAAVQEVGQLLAALPGAPVLVEGHAADTPGGADAGRLLSERRAVVVGEALVAAGVAGDRIVTRGRGAERPLATVVQSRRVEISIR